ncbi:MAG: hypothetical protein HETSPECPRED_005739 [Heterodermia speciosa]|uniref:Uncharacterized protein n=1 Tax=Heterodermia speciosa TaxID=116794 RepID=A0A8H3FIE5_9LECA|nr:MAG: hypothetical protein HETSPECPRED_005739 [Heterodermia speciosa]
MSNEAPIDGYVDPSIPNPNGEQDAPIIIYGYTPTLALSALAVALYALLLILHAYRLYAHRLYAFSILLILTTICEIVGYAFRLQSSPPPVGDPYNVINFVVQYFFIVVAPVFLSAALYTTLTSLIAYMGPHLSPLGLSRKTIIAVFVASDVVATIVQVAGAALIGSAESDRRSPNTANDILLAGLAFQVFSFLLFLLLLGLFIVNARKAAVSRGEGGMMRFTAAVVGGSLLVYLRTCFRLAETAQGVMGYASSHEAFFGALEFAPVVLAVAGLGWWHPGRLVGRRAQGGSGA